MINFDFEAELILENDAVQLRPLKLNDFENLLPFAVNEADLWEYSLVTAAGEANLKNYISSALHNRTERKEYPFIVWDKRNNQFAGSTRFYDIQTLHETLQLGYTWYGKKFQGTRLNKNCKYLLLEFAFEHKNFKRVEFRADHNNERSIAAMKSIGCTEEGVLRSNVIKSDGGRRDSIVLSILREEWLGNIKKMLGNKCVG
ncbi:MAG: GNAT family N-acetyltransferase [Saprospiraceae bacterium]|nr:GNAT family N-acetyltransferase [Saprospiraceae bacterium]MCC6844263.1 GNAT family N-acetyltransferase [Saprospiraceae bacterium]